MSPNFEKVKRKMIQDMKECPQHTQKNWADIMLRAARRCQTDVDQKDFFKYILNPNDSWDVPEPSFMRIETESDVCINTLQTMSIKVDGEEKESEIEFHNDIKTVGGTTFIQVKPVECKSS